MACSTLPAVRLHPSDSSVLAAWAGTWIVSIKLDNVEKVAEVAAFIINTDSEQIFLSGSSK